MGRRALLTLAALALAGCGIFGAAPRTPPPTVAPHASGYQGPKPVNPEQGKTYWAVYVAWGQRGDPKLTEASEALRAKGLQPRGGEAGCDRGAKEALGVSDDTIVVAVYFSAEQDARAFAASWTPEPKVVQVQTFCLD